MLKIHKITALLFVFSAMNAGCDELVTYPDTPVIDYKSFALYRTTDDLGNSFILGKMEIRFTDGDGDLGLSQPDSADVADSLKYNFYSSLHSLENGVWTEITGPLGEQKFRIPYIKREGQNKSLKGSVFVDYEYKLIEFDTIFYTFYMVDRQFHKSNTDTSEVLIFTGLDF